MYVCKHIGNQITKPKVYFLFAPKRREHSYSFISACRLVGVFEVFRFLYGTTPIGEFQRRYQVTKGGT